MKTGYPILLAILALLAVASGVAKITLMQNDVDFFGRYGFSAPMLIAFGVTQLIGGVLLPWKTTRFTGATVIACTFVVSLVMLIVDGNIPVSLITAIATLLLFVVMQQSWPLRSKGSTDG